MTLKRKLSAVGYPKNDLNLNDEADFRKVVAWLEQNKIKKLSTDLQKQLTDLNSSNWAECFDLYKQEVSCPGVKSKEALLDWFLGLAMQIEYDNKRDVYNKHTEDNLKSSKVPSVIADNPLDHLDFNSNDFAEGVNNIAKILKVVTHTNPAITLEACRKIIEKRLHAKALQNPGEYILKGTPFPYESTEHGFDLGDPVLNQAAKLLRLLYIHDLRNLQTSCNEVIVAVQTLTANPKTDTKLGKVGI